MYIKKLCKSSSKILSEADLMVKKLLYCINAINWTLIKQEKVENLLDLRGTYWLGSLWVCAFSDWSTNSRKVRVFLLQIFQLILWLWLFSIKSNCVNYGLRSVETLLCLFHVLCVFTELCVLSSYGFTHDSVHSRLVVRMARLGSNQSELEKDNRGINLEGHVSH